MYNTSLAEGGAPFRNPGTGGREGRGGGLRLLKKKKNRLFLIEM